ncbi:ABC transporter permease [Alkalihalobacillus sp. BA299]|uniref:ABC transporter permease n=1 Tax=Alkalihalobacillus sp. BA299 TaxID=2815938 RepID=UPI001ADD2F13|nr:ABC transporter permease [Alkalihalobacillus sp. BA299]
MMYLDKEWKELSRGKGLWSALGIVIILSIFLLLEARSFPTEHGFEAFLLSLYEMQIYFIPLLCLFLSSFAVMQEKELKTLIILVTKRESFRSFLLKKSVAIHGITTGVFISWHILFALPIKLFLSFNSIHFLYFLISIVVLILIFNQIGLLTGSICSTRIQLVGANIFIWFFLIFLVDLIFLYLLPYVTYANITIFSVFYFLDPLHSLRFFLETALGTFSLEFMSRFMEKMVWMSPVKFLMINLLIWLVLSFELAVLFHNKGEKQ